MTSANPSSLMASVVGTPCMGAQKTPPISIRKEIAMKMSARVIHVVSSSAPPRTPLPRMTGTPLLRRTHFLLVLMMRSWGRVTPP